MKKKEEAKYLEIKKDDMVVGYFNIPTPLPSFKNYLQNLSNYYGRKIPCFVCRGTGSVWHPDSESDPVEGNKMRDKIDCNVCKGSGEGLEDHHKAQYNFLKDKYKKEKLEFDNDLKKILEILGKLTSEELEHLYKINRRLAYSDKSKVEQMIV